MGAFLSVITYLACCGKHDASMLPQYLQDVTMQPQRESPAVMQEKQLEKAQQKHSEQQESQKTQQQSQQQSQPQQALQKQDKQKQMQQEQQQQQQQGTCSPASATTTITTSNTNNESTDTAATDATDTTRTSSSISSTSSTSSTTAFTTSSLPPSNSGSSPPNRKLHPKSTSKSKRHCPHCPSALLLATSTSPLALLPPTNTSASSWEAHHPAKHTRWMIFVSRYLWSVWQWPRYELETTKLFANEPRWALAKRVSQEWKEHMDAQMLRMLEQPWRMWDPVPFLGDGNVDYGLARGVMMGHLQGGI